MTPVIVVVPVPAKMSVGAVATALALFTPKFEIHKLLRFWVIVLVVVLCPAYQPI